MNKKLGFLASRPGIVVTGAAIGIIASVLSFLGNPANMGICVACFERDIAGALGLHRAAAVQYLRPEIPAFILGSLLAALLAGEWRPRTGSAPLARFVLGAFSMIGALVFLGCPWRAWLRLAGGDLNALLGLAGLFAGVLGGVFFLRRGYSLGRSYAAPKALGLVMPAIALGLLALAIAAPQFGLGADGAAIGPVYRSAKGPGSQAAPIVISIAAGLLIGYLAQRSRFCTVGAVRDVVLFKDGHLLYGLLALFGAALAANLALGRFKLGFEGQPVAHDDGLWNFLGMALSGLAFTLAGGCPGRQLFLSGEGDADAGVFVIGMIAGAAFAHNFNLASSGTGPSPYGPAAAVIGLVVVALIGFGFKERT
ncbi:MAG: YedE-related selenium metabolism membrane protein [Spirochaetes bacterium]|nr:YedE-related selenium metabolism membrane protein [Spirochaetota bacterium]MBU1081876.1 YedE-related selenium metabolism membrane protein [Spirochaetota bacterium]